MRRPGRGAGPRMLLWLCCALGVSLPAICVGASVLAGPSGALRGRMWRPAAGRAPGAPAAHLAAAPACLRCAALHPLRLSGGADDDDSDSESHEVGRAPRHDGSAGSEHRGVPAAGTPEAGVPARDGAGDRVLELVNATQTQLDKDKVFAGLRNLYLSKVKPLEEASWYSFFTPGATLDASDFDAKPIVLLLGQYSVGKTSFIRSLLGHDFAGMRIGPEPTTDQFMAVMHGNDERLVPGHALCMRKDSPFHGLADFGNNFLTRFAGATSTSPLLANITLIDTPGVLSGRKQRDGRDYDYSAVVEWFASRADLIIFMFDAHKLDISDELRSVIDKLKPHQVSLNPRLKPKLSRNPYIHTCTHTYIHTHIHVHTCIHTCIHARIHAYMHTCIRACIHTDIHTYIYIYIHTDMYTHTYT